MYHLNRSSFIWLVTCWTVYAKNKQPALGWQQTLGQFHQINLGKERQLLSLVFRPQKIWWQVRHATEPASSNGKSLQSNLIPLLQNSVHLLNWSLQIKRCIQVIIGRLV